MLGLHLPIVLALAAVVTPVSSIDWMRVKPMYMATMTSKDGDVQVFNMEANTIDMMTGNTPAMDRIFGGNVAQPNSIPYQVGLLLQKDSRMFWCGGTLISDEFVLTAAHCLDKADKALVFLGAHDIRNKNEPGQKRFVVTEDNFKIHPAWNSKRLKNDIALLRLPEPVEFTDKIRPIKLPKKSYNNVNFRGKLATASGWGRYASGVQSISNVLRHVDLEILAGNTCSHVYPMVYQTTNNICTSGLQARTTCMGDSGGPLVARKKKSKTKVLIGITSFGSVFGCDKGFPAAFTRIGNYLDWIETNTFYSRRKYASPEELAGVEAQSSIVPYSRFNEGVFFK